MIRMFKKTLHEQKRLNDEYEMLSSHNKSKSKEINSSIQRKSDHFKHHKSRNKKLFNSIRSK